MTVRRRILTKPNSKPELKMLSHELRELLAEREKRSRAQNDLLTYASTIEIPGSPVDSTNEDTEQFTPITTAFGAHHLLWIDLLQKVEDGKIKRLMGLMPPGSAKSTYTSIVFPTHCMGRFPGHSLIVASYGTDLPKKFGRKARSIVQQKKYFRIFDTTLSQESGAADEWALTNGSEWMAAGILTGITGNRMDGIIWDDLIKGREQADSETIRSKTWDAYMDDLLTRKKPHSFEIGITTRWHEDDPAGRILPLDYDGQSGWVQGRDGNDWYVLCLPAECERDDDPLGRMKGDILWPEWYTPEFLAPFKRNWRTWTSLFQQRPAPLTGEFFKAEWLQPFEEIKRGKYKVVSTGRTFNIDELTIYGASDYAVSVDKNDYTVHVVVGVDANSNIYLLDLWRKQTGPDEWIEALCDMILKWKPVGWAEETGQIRSAVGPFLTKRLRERRAFVARAQFPSRKDKAARAQSIRGRVAELGLHVPHHLAWYPDFRSELMSFPNGRNDDQVDALSLIGQALDKLIPGSGPKPPPEPPKVFSTNPGQCTVTMDDLWDANEKWRKRKTLRIA